MATRTFDPWIGSLYATEGIRGKRLLILGESHYGGAGCEYPAFTSDVIRDMALRKGRLPFFSRVQRLVVGGRGGFSNEERADFWHRVAFYNYVQSSPGNSPRCRPTPEMWEAASEPLRQTLLELSPHIMLVLGIELHRNLPPINNTVTVCPIQHPSSVGFSYNVWQPRVCTAMNRSQVSLGSPPNFAQ
jgi:hypothetical protein